jgi:tetratricopeptide (TPR) repeat protein
VTHGRNVSPRSARSSLAVRLMLITCAAGCGRPTPVADALLGSARQWSPSRFDAAAAQRELAHIMARVARASEQRPQTPRPSLLAAVLFEELGFEREVNDTDLRHVLLPSVLASRRGSCVGLGSLVLAVAERLGWPFEAVMVPGHFYVRAREPDGHRNMELLRRGEAMPDAWYATRFPIPGGSANEYGRALTLPEVLAVIAYDAGNESKRQGRWLDARRAYQSAAARFPQFAEAHASLGALAQLLGQLDAARAHYAAARRANPHLPGIDRNLQLLDAELSARQHE